MEEEQQSGDEAQDSRDDERIELTRRLIEASEDYCGDGDDQC